VARNRRYIDAPPERVFAILADAARYADWVVGSQRVREADPDFPTPKARFHHSVGVWPFVVRDHTEVVESDPPRRLKLEAKARPFGCATITLELVPQDGGTCVTMVEDPSGYTAPLRLVPLVHGLARLRNAESLRRLEALAERRPID
jgi:uncharacterized protein YndB with AHSA1/START domain